MFNFFRKRKARKEAAKQMEAAESVKVSEKETISPAPEKKEEPKVVPVKKEEPKVVPTKKEEPKAKPVKKEEPKPAAAKKTPTKKAPVKKETPKAVKYHVSQNKDEKSARFKEWRVRKQGSQKTIKYFQTQAEAIDYAKSLADNQDSSIVIHKVDGSIRKQDYSEK
jgi:outer membrane biosynthesis protein TonB